MPYNDGFNGGFSNYPIGSGGGGPSDGDYGDIVISSSGTVYTIDAGVVTFAKMANLATDRLIGRDTAGTGSPEALTVGGGIEFTGTGGIQTSAFTGDVTKSAGGTALTIPNNTVTYAKMQDMTTARVLGRTTAGSGDPEELSAGTGISIAAGAISSTITQYTDELAQDAVGNILTDSSTVDFTYNDAGNTITAAVIANSSTQKVEVTKNSGAVVGTRKQLNFIEGSNVTLTIADDAGNDQVDITVAASVGGAGISDGDYGDITVSGSGTAMTIDNDVVTYAKMQNVSATDRVLGRSTAGAGDVEEITCTAFGRSLIDDSDAATARTTLGAQASDATLTALAAYNTNGLITQTAADTFTGRTIAGTANEISVSNGDGVSGNPTLSLPATIDLGGKTSLEIPNGTGPTVSAAGQIAVDTNTDNSNITHGSIIFHDGTGTRYVPSIDTLPTTDDHVLAYDGTAKKFVFQAQSGGGGITGPGSSTDNAITRWDGTGGTAVQNSAASVNDDGLITTSINSGACLGTVPAWHWIRLTSDYTLTSSTSAQKLFNSSTNGTLTLPTGIYRYEAAIYITTMSATSGNATFSLGGTFGATAPLLVSNGGDTTTVTTTAGTTSGILTQNTTTTTNAVTAGTGTAMRVQLDGMVDISTGGTVIPNIALTTANAAVVKAGSWWAIWKIGETGETTKGAWT